MNKCFLLLLIIVYILYNCKPLIEPFDEYDTSQDATTGYEEPQGVEEDYFSYVYGLVAGEEDDSTSDPIEPDHCPSYSSTDNCGSFAADDSDWDYNLTGHNNWNPVSNSSSNNKDKCASCFRCKDGNRFVDSYYGWYCDALASGCGGDDVTNPDLYPFHYAHHSVEWEDECLEHGLTAQQTLTCNVLDNMITGKLKIFSQPQYAACTLEVAASEVMQ